MRPDDLLVQALRAALAQAPSLDPAAIEDIICGCAIPEGPQGLNIARIGAVLAGLPHSVGGITVNRFCASGLSAVQMAADRIRVGEADIMIAAGTVDSVSVVGEIVGRFTLGRGAAAVDLANATDGLGALKVAEGALQGLVRGQATAPIGDKGVIIVKGPGVGEEDGRALLDQRVHRRGRLGPRPGRMNEAARRLHASPVTTSPPKAPPHCAQEPS
jgi:hypothetical protein